MSRQKRTDALGRAYRGSQLKLQIYVNRCTEALNKAVLQALPDMSSPAEPRIEWVSPLEQCLFAEYRDTAFLHALGLECFDEALRGFWPRSGPSWDALAKLTFAGGNTVGVLLVEAKSYPGEFFKEGGSDASHPESVSRIAASLAETKCFFDADDTDWMNSRLYQSANRLAHLYFLRNIASIPTWLVDICFLNDSHQPTSQEQWDDFLPTLACELGLPAGMPENTTFVFLPAMDRSELVSATDPST